ncbi:MAG: hypothetical protein DMG41_26050 [Acidobacteria bacterium]|nr:MAG: hypothetical protein AUH13_02955 [Acidobacteria bacterium 13_2_20CM_58_27]PYT65899.1 MAG: hypothetical protein DMG42_31050 [Acidobacteriota bacterium]PYT84810.1 MAG: hypothetical protein DMG41_26050 [Acidobacteriota bacterium]
MSVTLTKLNRSVNASNCQRNAARAQQAGDGIKSAMAFSLDEIEKLDRLKISESITDDEFARLRAKVVQ